MDFIPNGKGNRTTEFGTEDIFAYIYAILHAPSYRSRYAELLRMDFPRIPFPSNAAFFKKILLLGEKLISLHVMEKTGSVLPNFPIASGNMVDGIRYEEATSADGTGRVWINKSQYFEGVESNVWEFQIGGYQVCAKWLKDRKGLILNFDDLEHYSRIVAAISETIELMDAIDVIIEEFGGWPLQ